MSVVYGYRVDTVEAAKLLGFKEATLDDISEFTRDLDHDIAAGKKMKKKLTRDEIIGIQLRRLSLDSAVSLLEAFFKAKEFDCYELHTDGCFLTVGRSLTEEMKGGMAVESISAYHFEELLTSKLAAVFTGAPKLYFVRHA